MGIIGGGCAGTLVGVNLLRRAGGPLRVALIERSGRFGPGVAYSTEDPGHLLNVPAERMSAFGEQPLHFAEWAARRLGTLTPACFLPRGLYGEYLQELLEESARKASAGRTLELVGDEVRSLRRTGAGIDSSSRTAPRWSVTVLCSPPARSPADRRSSCRRTPGSSSTPGLPVPWSPGGRAACRSYWAPGSRASTRCSRSAGRAGGLWRCRAVAAFRTRTCRACAAPPTPAGAARAGPLAALERLLAAHFREMQLIGYDWRDSIDGLRPVTAQLWSALAPRERRRFLQERRRAWEASRHRMAPTVGGQLRELLGSGAAEQLAGELLEVRAQPASLLVTVAVGGSRTVRRLSCERLVVCTGPGLDIRAAADPLLDSLLDGGLASTDPLGLGLRTSADGALRDPAGMVGGEILTLGALRRGELWETTAVDQIRIQARGLAETIEHSLDRRAWARPAHAASGAGGAALDQTTGLLATSGPNPTEVEQ